MFSPAEGDLLHGKLQKMNGPVPDVTASSPTTSTTAQPHLAAGLVQLTNGDFLSLMWSGRKVEDLGGAMFGDSHLQKSCDIMHVWLLQFTALGNRTPRAVHAKCHCLEKQYKQSCTEKVHPKANVGKPQSSVPIPVCTPRLAARMSAYRHGIGTHS